VVTAPDGAPVPGAEVKVYAFRSLENACAHYSAEFEGLEPIAGVTNDEGRVTLDYRDLTTGFPDKVTVSRLTLSIRHPGFPAITNLDVDVSKPGERVAFEPPAPLTLEAVSADGTPLEIHHVIAMQEGHDHVDPKAWRRDGSTATCANLRPGRASVLVVGGRPGEERLWFSTTRLLDLGEATNPRVRVELEPGAPVHGRLGGEAPRPVSGGIAKVFIYPEGSAAPDPLTCGLGVPVMWQESARIAADGTFVIEDVPARATLQLAAAAEGWVSGPGEVGDTGLVRCAQRVDITSRARDFVVPMEASATLRVRVTDSVGNPIDGVDVSTWPNLATGAGTTIFAFRHIGPLRERFDGSGAMTPEDGVVVTHARTNSDGIATLSNLPAVAMPLSVHGEGYEPRELVAESASGTESRALRPGETREVTVALARE
jgi:hypothetical protein